MRRDEPAGPRGEGSRERLILAGALVLALGAAVAGVLILGDGAEEGGQLPAGAERCVEEWNLDPEAVTLGRHQAGLPPSGHGYVRVQVATLDPEDGDELEATDPDAACALIFASPTLSEEAASAVLVRVDAVWQPLGGLHPQLDRLAALQQEAERDYNARIEADGKLTPP